MSKLMEREIIRQAGTFVCVGLLTTTLNYLIFVFLFKVFEIHYVLSSVSGYLCGLGLGYIFNKKYTFKSKEYFKRSGTVYLLVNSISICIILLVLPILVKNYSMNPLIANLILLAITTAINFFGSKILAFRNIRW